MAGYYDPKKDYSAEIAKTKDPDKRQKLLAERQNKLDDLQSKGQADKSWASNQTVSSWTDSYRPGGYDAQTGGYRPSGGNRPSGGSDREEREDRQPSGGGGYGPDIGEQILQGMREGMSAGEIRALMDARNDKAAASSALSQYYKDELWAQADAYARAREQEGGGLWDSVNSQLGGLWDQYESERRAAQQAYDRQQELARQKAAAGYDAQVPEIERRAADANTGAYHAYLQAVNPFGAQAQQEAALGLGGSGFAETNRAGLGSAYQSAVQQNETTRQEALSQLELAKQEAMTNGDMAQAERYAQLAYDLADKRLAHGQSILDYAYRSSLQQAQQDQAARELANRQAQSDRDYWTQMEQTGYDRRQQAWQNAMKLMQMGFTSEQIASQLGISQAEANAYAALARQSQAPAQAKGAGGRSGGAKGASSGAPSLEEQILKQLQSVYTKKGIAESVSYLRQLGYDADQSQQLLDRLGTGFRIPRPPLRQVEQEAEQLALQGASLEEIRALFRYYGYPLTGKYAGGEPGTGGVEGPNSGK